MHSLEIYFETIFEDIYACKGKNPGNFADPTHTLTISGNLINNQAFFCKKKLIHALQRSVFQITDLYTGCTKLSKTIFSFDSKAEKINILPLY